MYSGDRFLSLEDSGPFCRCLDCEVHLLSWTSDITAEDRIGQTERQDGPALEVCGGKGSSSWRVSKGSSIVTSPLCVRVHEVHLKAASAVGLWIQKEHSALYTEVKATDLSFWIADIALSETLLPK